MMDEWHSGFEALRLATFESLRKFLAENDFDMSEVAWNGSYWQRFHCRHKSGYWVTLSFRIGSTDLVNWCLLFQRPNSSDPTMICSEYGQTRSQSGFVKLFRRIAEHAADPNSAPTSDKPL